MFEISPLRRSGGSNVRDVTKGILKKLFTDTLGSQFSWYGVKGKKALASSTVADVLLAAVRANKATRETTDAEIIYVTKYWLRHAPERPRPRKSGSRKTTTEEA